MHLKILASAFWLHTSLSNAFTGIAQIHTQRAPFSATTALYSTVASSSTSSTSSGKKRAKSVADRTQEETLALIQDVIKASIEAGPQGGAART